MFTAIHLFFAGALPILLHWGLGVAAILILLALAYFSAAVPIIGPHLTELRRDLLWAAAAVALFLVGEAVGLHDGNTRCVAKTQVIEKVVRQAVVKTQTPTLRRQDDPWDNSRN